MPLSPPLPAAPTGLLTTANAAPTAPVPLVPVITAAASLHFLDRDHSILAFNERVLDWARRDDVPLLERLRFLCIVSSNLDEFFEVRAAPHLTTPGRIRGYTGLWAGSPARLSDGVLP